MTHRTCDGAGLVAAFRAGVANLEAHVEEVNELNVFPVPDAIAGRLEAGRRRQIDRRLFFAMTLNSLRRARGVIGGPTLPASPVRS